jgi:hypothetical protein
VASYAGRSDARHASGGCLRLASGLPARADGWSHSTPSRVIRELGAGAPTCSSHGVFPRRVAVALEVLRHQAHTFVNVMAKNRVTPADGGFWIRGHPCFCLPSNDRPSVGADTTGAGGHITMPIPRHRFGLTTR